MAEVDEIPAEPAAVVGSTAGNTYTIRPNFKHKWVLRAHRDIVRSRCSNSVAIGYHGTINNTQSTLQSKFLYYVLILPWCYNCMNPLSHEHIYYAYCTQRCRFRPVLVKDLIHKVLMETLNEKQYSSDDAKTWSKEISDTIKARLKGR